MHRSAEIVSVAKAAYTFHISAERIRRKITSGALHNYGKGRTFRVSLPEVSNAFGDIPPVQDQLKALHQEVETLEIKIHAFQKQLTNILTPAQMTRNQVAKWLSTHGPRYNTVKNWKDLPSDKAAALGFAISHITAIGFHARGVQLHECDDPACPCHHILPPYIKRHA